MKKLVSLFCVLAMMLSMLAVIPVSAGETSKAPSKWDGVVPEANKDYAFEGEGTAENPYLIKSAAELAQLAANVRSADEETCYDGKFFRLIVDIDLDNKEWYGIGGVFEKPAFAGDGTVPNGYFSGTFDGDNHKIYNLKLADAYMNGLFGFIKNDAPIKNIGIESGYSEMTGKTRVGCLIGGVTGAITVENCYNKASIKVTAPTAQALVGGIIGAGMDAGDKKISDCYNTGNVEVIDCAQNFRIGAMFGSLAGKTTYLTNCYSFGNVTITHTKPDTNANGNTNSASGVLAGAIMDNPVLKGCYANGDVKSADAEGKVTLYTTAFVGCYGGSQALAENVVDCSYTLTANTVTGTKQDDGATNTAGLTGYPMVNTVTVKVGEENKKFNVPNVELVTKVEAKALTDILPANLNGFLKESGNAPIEDETTPSVPVPEGASKWDGIVPEANKDYAFEGEGTEANPWLIKSAAELALFAANVRLNDKDTTYSGKYFKLTVDIDMDNKEWFGIGGCKTNGDGFPTTETDPYLFCYFAGHFDGDHHKIYNFNLATTAEVEVEVKDEEGNVTGTEKQVKALNHQGLFGWIVGATIRNIGIESGDVEFFNNNRSGLLVGASRHGFLLESCYNKANLTVNTTVKYTMVGNLMGVSMDAWKNDNNYEQNSEDVYKGKRFENCYNTGSLTVTMASTDAKNEFRIGAIIGPYVGGSPEMINVYNMGDVTVTSNSVASTGANARVGGLAGTMLDACYAEKVYNAGNITFTATVDTARAYNDIALLFGNVSNGFTSDPDADNNYFVGYKGTVTVNGTASEKAIGNKDFEWIQKLEEITLPLAENSTFLEIPVVEDTPVDPPVQTTEKPDDPATPTTEKGETTKAPTAEATKPAATQAPTTVVEPGCASAMGIASVLLITAIASGAALSIRRKED